MCLLSPTVGVRETRKLQGVISVTGADLLRGTKFVDGVVSCDNPIDEVMRVSTNMTHQTAIEKGNFYTLPFRALIPETVTNLMFAGRIISADATAFASVRGMPQCMAMGQATGTAAALALQFCCSVQEVDTKLLVKELAKQGVNRLEAAK